MYLKCLCYIYTNLCHAEEAWLTTVSHSAMILTCPKMRKILTSGKRPSLILQPLKYGNDRGFNIRKSPTPYTKQSHIGFPAPEFGNSDYFVNSDLATTSHVMKNASSIQFLSVFPLTRVTHEHRCQPTIWLIQIVISSVHASLKCCLPTCCGFQSGTSETHTYTHTHTFAWNEAVMYHSDTNPKSLLYSVIKLGQY